MLGTETDILERATSALGIFVLVTFDPLYFIRAFMATIGDTATFIVSLFMLSVFISR